MKTQTTNDKSQKADIFTVFVVIVGLLIAFVNIYNFAYKAQAGDAVWAGAAVFALSMILAQQLAKMRRRKN